MAQEQSAAQLNSILTVKKHHELRTVTQSDFAKKAQDVLHEADRGNQTTVRREDGSIAATVGLNGHRFFPDPNPDPLDDILKLALQTEKSRSISNSRWRRETDIPQKSVPTRNPSQVFQKSPVPLSFD